MSSTNDLEDEKSDDEECAICSNDLVKEFSRPEPCYHRFHTPCITTWAGIRLTCPMCREKFKRIFTYSLENKEHPRLTSTEVFEPPQEDVLDQIEMTTGMNPYEHTVCHICSGGENENQILLCDGCDEGFHMYCLTPALVRIPSGQWMCPDCSTTMQQARRRISRANHSVATRTADLSRIAAIVTRRLNISSGSEDSEEEGDFSAMDEAVLNDNIEPGTSNLPRVERRKRKRDRSVNVTQRRKRRTKRQRRKEKKLLKSLDTQRSSKDDRAEVARLSINGSGADHPFFEEDRKVERSAPQSPDESQRANCDLLGTILSEQEKVLANGKLFKIEGGKFKETEAYEKHKEKWHKKLEKEHKIRLGMPIEEGKEEKKPLQTPSSSRTKEEPNNGLIIDDREIDPEVEEQLAQMEKDEHDAAMQEILDAQRKAMAQQKREEHVRNVERNRERERAERDKKIRQLEKEEAARMDAKAQKEKDRRERKDRERKEKEEKLIKEREREREEERRRQREIDAAKERREEERKRKEKSSRRRSRSPRNRDDRRRDDRDRMSREKSRDDRDENKHRDSDRNKEREANAHTNVGSNNGRHASSNGSLPRPAPFVQNQAQPDLTAIFAAVPGLNPFLPNYGIQLGDPTTQMLLAQQQQLAAFGALPGTIPMSLPMVGNGLGIPGPMAPIQPMKQTVNVEEPKKEKKKSHAEKIIEAHSIRLVAQFFKNNKITRDQYKDIMKKLVREFRNSKSIDELNSRKCKEEIEQRAKVLLKPYDT